ncbi:MAG TPA: beta-ketoacyl synthase N-terminal-like domain-containing protein, partial [Thermoanaerobaculia bacterium]|nr:beta-ketoacyl synthase N-terminal-like domain-containing protein [Thermoanaerobaculia bacterium]
PDRTWSDRGGSVLGFDEVFDPRGFLVPPEELVGLDPLFLWTLHTARAALADAGMGTGALSRAGAVLGNLSFPSAGMARYAEAVWSERADRPDPRHRFGSGLPALLLERALGLDAGAFALDAACASSLYAIRYACDTLHEGRADVMLAGAVNCADDLFIHIGFSALGALSASGRSRPFHAEADGLVPAEGAAFVALERLEDALRHGHRIHGVIRGVGLANDGRGKGFLVPSTEGQERAIRAAYRQSSIAPATIGLLECHATGTQVGDATELRSLQAVLGDALDAADPPIPIGSLKSNLGHPITAAGVAGLIKVLEAMRAGVRPPTLHVERPIDALAATRFRLLERAEPWERCSDQPRRAGVSAFGFGGNNAHLIVEEWRGERVASASHGRGARVSGSAAVRRDAPRAIAIVGVGVVAAGCPDSRCFTAALLDGETLVRPVRIAAGGEALAAPIESFEVDVASAGVPPSDLRRTLAQQLVLLDAGCQAAADVAALPRESTGVFVGMAVDAEVARYGARWRLAMLLEGGVEGGLDPGALGALPGARDDVVPALESAGVVGTMPNIVANRLNRRLDVAGASCTVSAEEASGLRALELACRALRTGALDAALVGAVDLCCEPVHQSAARACLPVGKHVPGDAAVAIVLRRLDDALRNGDRIYALVEPSTENPVAGEWGPDPDQVSLTPRFGHAHAASGLLHLVAAALCLRHRILPDGMPWLGERPRTATVRARPMSGTATAPGWRLVEHRSPHGATLAVSERSPRAKKPHGFFHVYEGADAAEVLAALEAGRSADAPSEQARALARLVVAAGDAPTLARRVERARRHLRDGAPAGEGVHFRSAPVVGELALVFASAGTAYPGMGRDLLRVLPELGERVDDRFGDLEPSLRWAFRSRDRADPADAPAPTPSNSERLWGASAICRLHSELTLGLLDLCPDAAIGYSSGESTALFALGVWTDIEAMRRDIEHEGLFDRALGGRYEAVARAWGLAAGDDRTVVDWAVWNVLADVDRVRALLRGEQRLHLAILHSPRNCVIAGDAAAAERVVEAIGRQRCHRLEYDLACHVPEVEAFREPWLRIHRRGVTPVPTFRFYSAGRDDAYEPSTESCAQAILGQAVDTLDFPRVIENAWRDGVRVFVEHGPQGACSGWIREILGERAAGCVIVALDRGPRPEPREPREPRDQALGPSHGLEPVLEAVAALLAAGVALDTRSVEQALGTYLTARRDDGAADTAGAYHTRNPRQLLRLPGHPPPVRLPRLPAASTEHMAPAPRLPSVFGEARLPLSTPRSPANVVTPPLVAAAPAAQILPFTPAQPPAGALPVADREPWQAQLDRVRRVHREFVEHQARAHTRFLAGRYPGRYPGPGPAAPEPQVRDPSLDSLELIGAAAVPAAMPETISEAPAARPDGPRPATAERDRGPSFDRAQLEVHASGRISEIFGPHFAAQDAYARQVRMPEPPLLLADRVTGLDAEPGVRGTGTIWTETDVRADSWYLHRGRMPAGVMIEAGQADLMLISYMGADLLNRGERVYRLLGCELTYLDDLPRPGETLAYEIRVDGHAEQDGIRLFFFHYDCHTADRPRIRVREGQAGFFTDEELRASAGVLWSPEEVAPRSDARLDPPDVVCARRSFEASQVRAFAEGRLWECFGDGFDLAKTHTDTPTIQSKDMLFLDRVPVLALDGDSGGGPWGRGYLRAESTVSPDKWYFAGHFRNDPCMPGTLMFEGCLQAMSFAMAAMGFTLQRDGWRFQPVIGEPIPMRCRGQVTPESRELVYEIFVEEIVAGPLPTVYADVLCTVDGLKAFHARRVGLQLVPSWPLESSPHLLDEQLERARQHPGFRRSTRVARIAPSAATEDGLDLDYASLLACAWGRPSHSFGPMYRRFDAPGRVPRLPGPPYHFLSRVVAVTGEPGAMTNGSTVEVEYDVPVDGPDAWYFDDNGARTMPWAVLLEAALQPCGWLASYIGSALTVDTELCFRNLDGTATVLQEVLDGTVAASGAAADDVNTLRTRVKLTNISRSGSTIIVGFEVEGFLGASRVLDLRTVFGFFPSEALAHQVGLPTTDEQRALLATPSDRVVELADEPERYFGGSLRLARGKLRMLDRVTGYWPDGGDAGLGRLRAERDVDAGDWYFQAHFFQDPVQPGSLGIEAMVQLLQFFLIESGAAEGIAEPRFEPLATGVPITWKYRGQVVPANQRIAITLDVTTVTREENAVVATAGASLWCDGKRIYSADNLGMRVVSGAPPSTETRRERTPWETTRAVSGAALPRVDGSVPSTEATTSSSLRQTQGARPESSQTLDPAVDTWLLDHRPTWCRPSLPMMSVVDQIAAAVPADQR